MYIKIIFILIRIKIAPCNGVSITIKLYFEYLHGVIGFVGVIERVGVVVYCCRITLKYCNDLSIHVNSIRE